LVIKCQQCGTENKDKTKYCSNCGALLMVTPPALGTPAIKPVPGVKVVTPLAGVTRIPSPGMCYYHPTLRAKYVCSRDGRQICTDCAKPYLDLILCPTCYRDLSPTFGAPPAPYETPSAPFAPPTGGVRAMAGFALSMIAGFLIVLNTLLMASGAWSWIPLALPLPTTYLAFLGLIFGGTAIIGGMLTYWPARELLGGVLVIVASVLSTIVGGGFVVGLILGIVGGILAIFKK